MLVAPMMVSVADATAALSLPAEYADQLERWIKAVTGSILRMVDREKFGLLSTVVEELAGSGRQKLLLARGPVVGTPVVLEDDAAVTDFVIAPRWAMLYREAGWQKNLAVVNSFGILAEPTGEAGNTISVTYRAGFVPYDQDITVDGTVEHLVADVPEEIVEAAIELLAARLTRRQHSSGVASETVGSMSISYRKTDEMPEAALAALDPWK